MRVVTPGGLGNSVQQLEAEIDAALDSPDRFGLTGQDPTGRQGWLNGWYVGVLAEIAQHRSLPAPAPSQLLAAALTLDVRHPYLPTWLRTTPAHRLPITELAIYRPQHGAWDRQ